MFCRYCAEIVLGTSSLNVLTHVLIHSPILLPILLYFSKIATKSCVHWLHVKVAFLVLGTYYNYSNLRLFTVIIYDLKADLKKKTKKMEYLNFYLIDLCLRISTIGVHLSHPLFPNVY